MGNQEDWQRVRAEVSELADLDVKLDPAVENIRLITDAQPKPPGYDPELMSTLVAIVKDVSPRLHEGESFEQAMRAVMPRFEQTITAHTVQNAARIINVSMMSDSDGTDESRASTPVPVVLLVMTRDEADELADGRAFRGFPAALPQSFEQLRTLLQESAVSDWPDRYGVEPADWRPFGVTSRSIGDLVAEAVNQVDEEVELRRPLAPRFVNPGDVVKLARRDLRDLRQKGCLVVMDTVSMCHPILQHAYHQTMLDAFPHAAFVAIAPIAGVMDRARDLSIVLQLRLADLEFAKRRHDVGGRSTETSEPRTFEQWLRDNILNLTSALVNESDVRRPFFPFGSRDRGAR